MTNDSTSDACDAVRGCAVAVNAAKVLDTTRRAWTAAPAVEAEQQAERRPPHAVRKKRVVPRRSRWPSLIAALNHWSPKPR
jgi:hypothetical protein